MELLKFKLLTQPTSSQYKNYHRLQQTEPSPNIVSKIIFEILDQVHTESHREEIENANTTCLRDGFMKQEINRFVQAYPPYAPLTSILQDTLSNVHVKENHRPCSASIARHIYSAKVRKSSIFKNTYRTNSYKNSYRNSYSKRPSTTSKNTISKKKHTFQNVDEKFYQLNPTPGFQDEDDLLIEFLRKQKNSENKEVQKKEEFIRNIQSEEVIYPKLQKKFMQLNQNKNLFYGKNGQTIEIHQKFTKKSPNNHINITFGNERKSGVSSTRSKPQEIIEFSNKQNLLRKNKEAYFVENKEQQLFYQSDQCKYQIVRS